MISELTRRTAQALADFLRLESAGGILLIAAAVLALIAANSPLAGAYVALFNLPLQIHIGACAIGMPLMLWINDGFMAVFFLLVGLELKRELIEGQFADRAQIALPGLCALSGMVVPMAIYALLNHGNATDMAGVAIPAATDIAFALGVLSLLGSRVPLALKVLLTAIAVADDLGAILIIALFYSHDLSLAAAGVALAALAGLVILNRRGVTRLTPYLLIGLVLWVVMLKSGVHATLAGVFLGMTIPVRSRRDAMARPLETLEHGLHPWVAFGILPLFAFANAGVPLAGLSLSSLAKPVPLGIAAGLVLGKQIGIFGTAALVIGLGWVRMPDGLRWSSLYGMAILCGIGFTMSLFIGSLAFENGHPDLMVANRIGILAGSMVSAGVGYFVLRVLLPQPVASA
ncbi:MAG: Na+/H+ antiporter NhaA [Stenotrophobium sp.]